MADRELGSQALEKALGYLNFSSGAPDPLFLKNLDQIFETFSLDSGDTPPQSEISSPPSEHALAANCTPVWRQVGQKLLAQLEVVRQQSPAFQNCDQAQSVIQLTWDQVLPGYLDFHRDLLFHQRDVALFNPFFVGRACEATLRQQPPWSEQDRIVKGAIRFLNDYIGHRPVPVLAGHKCEPYPHERVRPVPIWVRGAGAAYGPYASWGRKVVEAAIQLLEETDEDLLRAAHFDPHVMDELAFDPRAYDFDHPVNRRPNYHFGQWDPHCIDNQGRYRRFIIQQVTLDALMSRLGDSSTIAPVEELVFEAASVLAGTVLMASGISGWGPETHDSTTTLAGLLPAIASYRDEFYDRLFHRLEGAHAERLGEESRIKRQPFGAARQHLNAQLARLRAAQLEHVHLARLYARMGYSAAAAKQADHAPVASARMVCQMDCWLTEGRLAVQTGQIQRAAELPGKIVELLRRAIHCGAVIDPWNILGFDANFSLFPAPENGIRDHRADELVGLMEELFALYARIWSAAAAADCQPICEQVCVEFRESAEWWMQYAVHELSSIECASSMDLYHAAEHVSRALHLWHQGGASTGDVAFWTPHADLFDSPKAYELVIESLLERKDFVASMALLLHWINHAQQTPLEQGDSSFHVLALQWLVELERNQFRTVEIDVVSPDPTSPDPISQDAAAAAKIDADAVQGYWVLVRRFFDYLEANAEDYWSVPSFVLGGPASSQDRSGDGGSSVDGHAANKPRGKSPAGEGVDDLYDDLFDDSMDSNEDDDLFQAAYENMLYHDSADDGVEGPIFEPTATDDELEGESRRIIDRLGFLTAVARLWKRAALLSCANPFVANAANVASQEFDSQHYLHRSQALTRWCEQAWRFRDGLQTLLQSVDEFEIHPPSADYDAMVEYDRRRLTKETLLEHIINTTVEITDSARFLAAAAGIGVSAGGNGIAGQGDATAAEEGSLAPDDESGLIIKAFRRLLERNVDGLQSEWSNLLGVLGDKPLLYVPLARGGGPHQIVESRVRQQAIQDMMSWLPRVGLLTETCRLIETAREMERNNPVGAGAVTEFDEMFKIGYAAIVESIITSAKHWPIEQDQRARVLIGSLEQLTESLLVSWLAHSRTLRLSVLERVRNKSAWRRLVEFVERYGADLFTQRFFNLGNIRAILHQGVDEWLRQVEQCPEGMYDWKLLDELDEVIPREEAVDLLTLVLEAIIENYGEYRDYNSTTTQSDRGELLYMLLDFLRLRVRYDRVAWNLKPVIVAHEILLRHGRRDAADFWRQILEERISSEANRFLDKLGELQKKYAMRMPTVADRIEERFLLPMTIDRMRTLVGPAMEQARKGEPPTAFQQLSHQADLLTAEPTGVGLDPPPWLIALEEEIEASQHQLFDHVDPMDVGQIMPRNHLRHEDVQRQLDEWSRTD